MTLPLLAAGMFITAGVYWILKDDKGETEMHDCNKDLKAFHDEKVNLRQQDRDDMRDRRNANRDQLDRGLKRDNEPAPVMKKSQGSYAMWTMIQDAECKYDIDDGIYFKAEDLKNRSTKSVKKMIKEAVFKESFNEPPEVRDNCVRVPYSKGYHVDLPVYRIMEHGTEEEYYELASTDWKESDPQEVTRWFKDEVKEQGDEDDSQLRRIVRYLKAFSRSREEWKEDKKNVTGFMISVLVVEKFRPDERDDQSLYNTMKDIRDRLDEDKEIEHPVLYENLTEDDDKRPGFFKETLNYALEDLKPLFIYGVAREDALAAWDKVFNTDFFSKRGDAGNGNGKSAYAPGIIKKGTAAPRKKVNKVGGGRNA